MVYVLDIDGTPLMPTERYGKVRRMLNRNEAKIVNRRPFTIQLLYKTTKYVQPVTLGVDASNKVVGLSASTSEKEVYASEVELRKDVSILVKQKKRLTNIRRKRKARIARPNEKKRVTKKQLPYYVFERISPNKRTHKKLKVSSEQKIQSHISIINRVTKMIPINRIVIETNQFDKSMIDKPYMAKTTFYSSNQREYVINRDFHKCQWCKGKNGDKVLVTRSIMEPPIIYPEYYHSTSNTITLCKTCSDHIDEMKKRYEELRSKGKKPRGRNYKSIMVALSNIAMQRTMKPLSGRMRMKVYQKLLKIYPNVDKVKGCAIKQIRINEGLKNTPINNARIMTGNHPVFLEKYYYMKLRRNHNRQLQKATPLKNSGIRSIKSPYFTRGFASYDLVLFNGKEYFITKKRKSGYFSLGLADGTTLINSVKWNRIRLLQRRKSYSAEERLCSC